MYLIKASDIRVAYGDRTIFEIEDLEVARSARVGLVGRNGAGKSTLLQVLAGVVEPDEGWLDLRARIAYIPQEPELAELVKLVKMAAAGRPTGRSAFGHQVLSARPSGGELTRAAIARAFASGAELLLADEPTTNLDVAGIEQLQRELLSFRGGLLLISHDRELLDAVCTEIWELENGTLRSFPGNYSAWCLQRDRERAFAQEEYEGYQRERKRLEEAARRTAERARTATKRPHGISDSDARLISSKNKGTNAQHTLNAASRAMERRAEKLERHERPDDLPEIKMSLGHMDRLEAPFAVRVTGLDVAFGDRVLLRGATFDLVSGKKTVLMGPNGSGKTSLLRLIESELEIPGIRRSPRLRAGFFGQAHEALDGERTVLENARALSDLPEHEVRTILARLEIRGDAVYKRGAVLSGGERAKVAFARLLASSLNTLVLDEPTNHIDIYTAEALEGLLRAWQGTLLLVTHDRRLAAAVADRLLFIENGAVRTFEGSWAEHEASRAIRRNREAAGCPARRSLLEMRMVELSARIAAAPDPAAKTRLEAEWRQCAQKLNGVGTDLE